MSLFFLLAATLPFFLPLYHKPMYFILLGVGYIFTAYRIVFDKREEEAFTRRWQRMRGYPKWLVMCIQLLKGSFIICLGTFGGQYFGNDRSLFFIFSVLKVKQIIFVTILIFAFGAISGYASFVAKEKRYSKLTFKQIRESKEKML